MKGVGGLTTAAAFMATMALRDRPALAQPAPSVDLSWFTLEPSAILTGPGVELAGTLGQPDASLAPLTGSNGQVTIDLLGGFWAAGLNESVNWTWKPTSLQECFTNAANWNMGPAGLVPGDLDEVVFGPTGFPDYTVDVPLSLAIGRMRVLSGAGTVFLRVFGTELTLQGSEISSEPSLVVGEGGTVLLVVQNQMGLQPHGLTAQSVAIGDGCPGLGRLHVLDGLGDTTPTRLRSTGTFWVGRAGKGSFQVVRAQAETTGEVIIGALPCPESSQMLECGGVLGNADGLVLLDGAAWRIGLDDPAPKALTVGQSGQGKICITDGARLESRTAQVALGLEPGSSAEVIIKGADDQGQGSTWQEQGTGTLRLGVEGTAIVSVEGQGTLEVPEIIIGPGGVLDGDGTVSAMNIFNSGTVAPGVYGDAPAIGGTLTIASDYYQDLTPAGTLATRVGLAAGTGRLVWDDVVVAGNAFLGGGLVVQVQPGVVPAPTDTLSVLAAGGGTSGSRFNVAFYPALPDRIMRLCYPEQPCGAGAGLESVGIGFETFEQFFEFDAVEGGDPGVPADAALGRINDDPYPDLIVAVPGAGAVVVLFNAQVDGRGNWQGFGGAGGFSTQVGASPAALATGYFDGDARLDVAVASTQGSDVRILRNVNGASFATIFTQTQGVAGPQSLGAGELNGRVEAGSIPQPDPAQAGTPDLAIGNGASGTVLLLTNDGDGTFTFLDLLTLPSGGAAAGPGALAAPSATFPLDVDNDKDLDLAVATSTGQLLIYENQDGGFPAEPPAALQLPVGGEPVDLAAGDLDGNGRQDLVTANLEGTVSVFVNATAGPTPALQPAVALPAVAPDEAGAPKGKPEALVIANVDGDDDLDIVVAATGTSTPLTALQLLRNDFDPMTQQLVFAGVQDAADFQLTAPDPLLVLSDDLDVDRDPDLVAISGDDPGAAPIGPPVSPVKGFVNDLLAPPPPCPGDVDGNLEVNVQDLVSVILAWDSADPEADVDGNGVVDVADLVIVVLNWGSC